MSPETSQALAFFISGFVIGCISGSAWRKRIDKWRKG